MLVAGPGPSLGRGVGMALDAPRLREQRDDSRIGLVARGSAAVRRMWRRAAGSRSSKALPNEVGRQQRFAQLFREEFVRISEDFGGEPRRARRLMARRSARRLMQEAR